MINEVASPLKDPVIQRELSNLFHEIKTEKLTSYSQKEILNFQNNFNLWINSGSQIHDFCESCFYVSQGANEGLFFSILEENKKICFMSQDYFFYEFICKNANKNFRILNEGDCPRFDEIFLVSVPNYSDGSFNSQVDKLMKYCEENSIECWVDAAYYGTHSKKILNLGKCVTRIFFSFTKSFGFDFLKFGVIKSSRKIKYYEKIHKNKLIPSIGVLLANDLVQNYDNLYLFNKFQKIQVKICTENKFTPADAVWLAVSHTKQRVCLSKIIQEFYCAK